MLVQWHTPNMGVIRINMDAALKTTDSKVEWGIVARDWKGNLLTTWAVPRRQSGEPAVEEALAITWGLTKAQEEWWESTKVQK